MTSLPTDLMSSRLRAQYALSRVLASASGVEALPRILDVIGESLRADVAELWVADPEAAVLRCSATWAAPGAHGAAFATPKESMTFARGEGLPGRVWAGGQPAWSKDILVDRGFVRKAAADAAGLHAAVAFPVQFAGETIGVIQFFYGEVLEPNAELLSSFADVGSQVGLFLERARMGETLVRQAREILELATPVIRIWDRVLFAPVFGPLDSQQANVLSERVLTAVERNRARVLLLDVTGVPRIDTEIARRLIDMTRAARLLGTSTVVTGVRAQIAMTLTHLGISLDEVESFTTLEDGLRRAFELVGADKSTPSS